MPKPAPAPADRLPKLPRRTHVDIVMDDALADAYDERAAALSKLEERQAASLPRRLAAARASVIADGDPDALAVALEAVRAGDAAELAELRALVDEARDALVDATTRYTFRALGRKAWQDLKAAHPPTDEDHATTLEASGGQHKRAEFHFDTLAPALVELASVSPKLSADEVAAIFDGGDWNDVEIVALYNTALLAQIQSRVNPLAAGPNRR